MRKSLWFFLATLFMSCHSMEKEKEREDPYQIKRNRMVEEQIVERGVRHPEVISAMKKVARDQFVPEKERPYAYDDYPLPIGHGQTISQPYIVAFMTEILSPGKKEKILEIGTGSGYQAAVLGELAQSVYTIEIVQALAMTAEKKLREMGYSNIFVKYGDGYEGWPSEAPFDGIIVTAAPPEIPPKLLEQLKVGGRMVIPVGTFDQGLYLITRTAKDFEKKHLLPVRFVPMVNEKK